MAAEPKQATRQDPGFRSLAFTPGGKPSGVRQRKGKRYLLDAIPSVFWARVRAKAKRQKVSVRGLILGKLRDWLEEPETTGRFIEAAEKGE